MTQVEEQATWLGIIVDAATRRYPMYLLTYKRSAFKFYLTTIAQAGLHI